MATPASKAVTPRTVFAAWWPLATSWMLMGLELPLISAFIARLPHPQIGLAAYGSVVLPVALVIESPIIMLLAASTATSRNWDAYRVGRRLMWRWSLTLTALHALVAFTPLYDAVVVTLMGIPPEVREPARLGLQIMTPWTAAIAYRRFQQGVLIRFDRSRWVGLGTAVRLLGNLVVLTVGMAYGHLPGIVVGTLAVTTGVVAEAVFAGIVVHPVLAGSVRAAPPESHPLTDAAFLRFYLPLAFTPLLMFLAMPLASSAMSRMPRALDSLAVSPVVHGLTLTMRSLGFAFNEVVVAMLDRAGAPAALRRFIARLAAITCGVLLLIAATPLGGLWFRRVSALPPDLAALAAAAMWISFVLPALTAFQSWYQGVLVHSRKTRGVTESMAASLLAIVAVLGAGVALQRWTGVFVAVSAMVAGNAAQVAWLRLRARPALHALRAAAAPPVPVPEPASALTAP